MNLSSLQTLTWGTIAGAIVSALLLAAVESGLPDQPRAASRRDAAAPPLPTQPTAAGPSGSVPPATERARDAAPRH